MPKTLRLSPGRVRSTSSAKGIPSRTATNALTRPVCADRASGFQTARSAAASDCISKPVPTRAATNGENTIAAASRTAIPVRILGMAFIDQAESL